MAEITKQDALKWLDLQRDAVNTEIVYAAQDEKKQYHDHLKIINWLAEAARIHCDEMTAAEYLEARKEMCNSYMTEPNKDKRPSRAIEIVKKWKEEQDGH